MLFLLKDRLFQKELEPLFQSYTGLCQLISEMKELLFSNIENSVWEQKKEQWRISPLISEPNTIKISKPIKIILRHDYKKALSS